MKIIIDVKEKTPWSFPCGVDTEVRDLRQGDYALAHDGTFSIERKSLDDFIGTVGVSYRWERLQKELRRMDVCGHAHKVIIVEGNYEQFCFKYGDDGIILEPDHNHVQFTPQLANKRIAQLTVYHRTSVLFAGDETLAAGMAFQIFCERAVQLGGRLTPKDLL